MFVLVFCVLGWGGEVLFCFSSIFSSSMIKYTKNENVSKLKLLELKATLDKMMILLKHTITQI